MMTKEEAAEVEGLRAIEKGLTFLSEDLRAENARLTAEVSMLRMMRDADTEKINEYIDKTREAEGDAVRLREENERLTAEVEAMYPIVEAAEAFAEACDANLYDGEDIDTEPLLDTLRAACLAAAEAEDAATADGGAQ